ncbi:MAG: universal stress protein [Kofleriaceae bacterium]
MFKRILVGYDLSTQSRRALGMASGLARLFGCSLTVVHVLPLPAVLKRWSSPTAKLDLEQYESVLKHQHEAALHELERDVVRLAATPLLDVHCMVRTGSPPTVLVEVAERINADLVVVGRGKRGVLGPTSERVVRLSGRTVLVTPVSGAYGAAIKFGGAEREGRVPRSGRIRARRAKPRARS